MRTRVLVAVAVGVCLSSPSRAAHYTPCAGGPFAIQGQPLLGTGDTDSDKVFLAGSEVSTQSGCMPVAGSVRASKQGTRIRAKWKGCGLTAGPQVLTAMVDPATCNTMQGTFKTRGVPATRGFVATRLTVTCEDERNRDTFDLIQKRIFATHGCNVSTCHGPFAEGGLDLRYGAAYGSLVDVAATNAAASAAGKKRVVTDDAADSFLSQKLHGTQGAGEGSRMPLIGTALTQPEMDVVDAWINAGAPQTGVVAGVPCLPPLGYTPSNAPPKPKGGLQFVLNGPILFPGEEQEGCFWIPLPNKTDFYTNKWEFVLNPGTHHFSVFTNRDDVPSPPANQWLLNDFGCFTEAEHALTLSGAPESPYYVDTYPSGIARVLHAGKFIGLNAHYHNDFDVPIQMKVWTNVYPYPGTPQHTAKTVTSLDTTYNIDVPPFTQKTQRGRFVNTSGVPMSFIQISGHMHKRGLRFTAWRSDGSVLYENFDWAHAIANLYSPPFVLAPGDYIDYECLEDNGVTRPVKVDSAGNPIDVRFGVTTDDEMCILPAVYYDQ